MAKSEQAGSAICAMSVTLYLCDLLKPHER